MDDLEQRVAALELYCIEVGAWLDRGALDDAEASIKAGLETSSSDERAIRLQALKLIEDARKRFAGPDTGVRL